MLSIRFSRVGKKKAPIYRIVVMPKHKDPWAPATEILGHYNPRKSGFNDASGLQAGQAKEFVINIDRIKHWLSQGAEATDSVWNLLVEHKVVEGEKRSTTHISKKHAAKLEARKKEEEIKKAPKEEPAA